MLKNKEIMEARINGYGVFKRKCSFDAFLHLLKSIFKRHAKPISNDNRIESFLFVQHIPSYPQKKSTPLLSNPTEGLFIWYVHDGEGQHSFTKEDSIIIEINIAIHNFQQYYPYFANLSDYTVTTRCIDASSNKYEMRISSMNKQVMKKIASQLSQ
ncbi:hypothetical protein FZC66_18220 [Priestia megaterium]|nr:hypothetical protein FZC66_18220 [Priestia megaterium]